MNSTPDQLRAKYPQLLRRGQAFALAKEMGVTCNCLRTLIEIGQLPKRTPTGKYAWFRRDDVISLLS